MTVNHHLLDISLEAIEHCEINIDSLIAERRSWGSFTADIPTPDQILSLLHAMRCAPSFNNSQPWYAIVIENGPGRARINEELRRAEREWAVQAPILIGLVVNWDESVEHEGTQYAMLDCGAAMQNLLLQAGALGLAAHPVICGRRTEIARELHIPPRSELVLFIAVGLPAPQPITSNADRRRKPLSHSASFDRWDGVRVTI